MKRVFLLLLLPVTLGAACGTGDNKKGGNGGWSEAERKAFMSNCITSAEKTYEERGSSRIQPLLPVCVNSVDRRSKKSIAIKTLIK
ncbi:hypothetical protein KRR40_07870 [Niabella defluvii]|nr:hypothetical protein KRR40_07870 [Niabella sp. I65]